MELRQLKTLTAAANLESFTRAAAELGITQAAVSQQIGSLERELGTSLFERRGRGVHLTEHGRDLYDRAQRILELVEQASLIGKLEPELAGTLTIATSTVPSEWLLPEMLADFRTKWPQVRESVLVSDSRDAAAAVESGKADLGFIGEPTASPRLESLAIAEDELMLTVAAQHPLAATGRATLKQLQQETLIVRETGSGSWNCVSQELEEHGIKLRDLSVAMQANSNDAIRAAVQRGVGVAFLSSRTPFADLGLVAVKIRGFRPKRQLFLVHNPSNRLSPVAQEFLEFVAERKQLRRK